MTYEDYIPNEDIKAGDVFHGIYEVISNPKITSCGYEWIIYHRRWHTYLRMLRPDPTLFLHMPEHEQQSIISLYQRYFIPMQQHPRIERFYDVRHIGGSAAFFTEWAQRGTLTECMKDGSLYQGDEAEVGNRLLRIVAQTARALQFLEEKRLPYGIVSPDNIMISDRFNAKLSMANLLAQIAVNRELQTDPDKTKWAITAMQMYLGEKIDTDADNLTENYPAYKSQMKIEIPKELELSVVAALVAKLPSWQHVFVYLKEPLTRDYPDDWEGYENNRALRLIDCGKWEAAGEILLDLSQGFPDRSPFRYNWLLLGRYITEKRMNNSFGDVDVLDIIFKPTDILLFAEWNDRKNVQRLNEKYGENLPECVARYLPEIHEKLLDRPHMTRIDLEPDDPRVNRTDDWIVIELDGKKRLFKPLPDGENDVPVPGKDGLIWRKNKLVLPGSGVIGGIDYTVKKFDFKSNGSGFMFDEGMEWLLVDEERLYPLAQYDNRFRAPFLLSTCDSWEDEI